MPKARYILINLTTIGLGAGPMLAQLAVSIEKCMRTIATRSVSAFCQLAMNYLCLKGRKGMGTVLSDTCLWFINFELAELKLRKIS
jgi:hypothetical protein